MKAGGVGSGTAFTRANRATSRDESRARLGAHSLFVVGTDEAATAAADVFASEGFAVETHARDAGTVARVADASHDAVLVVLGNGGLAGTEFCRRVREVSTTLLVVVARPEDEVAAVLSLECGADAVVGRNHVGPLLVAAVRALLRRRDAERASARSVRTVGPLELDVERHEVRVDGALVSTTPSEFKILRRLSDEPGRVFTRDELMDELWGMTFNGDSRVCDLHVTRLRRKIERDPANPRLLVTVRGIGYKLEP